MQVLDIVRAHTDATTRAAARRTDGVQILDIVRAATSGARTRCLSAPAPRPM